MISFTLTRLAKRQRIFFRASFVNRSQYMSGPFCCFFKKNEGFSFVVPAIDKILGIDQDRHARGMVVRRVISY